jgi:succinate dehydrogenase flavin-adding protein (antitoxin of CptAB toxin-antitoxin module)
MSEMDRVRWRCRRGLLELDLILQSFLERRFEGLTAQERGVFDELLELPDNDLLDWAMGRSEPDDARFVGVVNLLRAA